MTDYKIEFSETLSKEKEEFFKEKKQHFVNENHQLLSNLLESDTVVQKHSEYSKNFRPPLQALEPATFAAYGKAEQYYEDSAYSIINYYPFDGTREETLDWFLSSSNLDAALLQQEWPTNVGHLKFNSSEYIDFYTGPHAIPESKYIGRYKNEETGLKIDPYKGNTVEFWLKKTGFSDAVETIFDIGTYPGKVESANRFDFRLIMDPSADDCFKLTYKSGSTGLSDITIGAGKLTKTAIADSNWHHYAIKVYNGESYTKQEQVGEMQVQRIKTPVVIKSYIDGVAIETLKTELPMSQYVGPCDTYMGGTIAANRETKAGKLNASMDNFRFWKGKRDSRQIHRFFDQKIYASDHSEKDYTSRLGLNYTFNEAAILTSSIDSLAVDYSGNDITGQIINYSNDCRVTQSAIDLSSVSENTEIKDPILLASHNKVKSLRNRLESIARSYDISNSNTLLKSLPDWAASELYGFETTEELDNLLHLLATVFDSVKMNLDSLRFYTRPEYSNARGTPEPNDTPLNANSTLEENFSKKGQVYNTFTYENKIDFAKRLLSNYGFDLGKRSLLWTAEVEELVESIVDNKRLERGIEETRRMMYDCLANAASYVLNKKGTETSYNSILNAVAMGRDVVSINILGQNSEIHINEEKEERVVRKLNSISFRENRTAVLHQTSPATDTDTRSFIGAHNKEYDYTFEGNFIFPKREAHAHYILDSSIFGINQVAATNNVFTTQDPNNAGFCVKATKDNLRDGDAKFILICPGSISNIETEVFKDVYDTSVWNLSIRVNRTNIFNTSATYNIEFAGYNYISEQLRYSFSKTVEITRTQYENFRNANKTCFIGAQRENITGTLLTNSDIKVLDFNAWNKSLNSDTLKTRARTLATPGVEDPHKHTLVYTDVATQPAPSEGIIFKMQSLDLTPGSFDADAIIKDETSGSREMRDFYEDTRGYKYPFKFHGFSNSLGKIIQKQHLSALRSIPLTNLHGSQEVKIRDGVSDLYGIGSRPEQKILSFEKSMYRSFTNEMLDFISGVQSYNNLIGEPINKYRKDYKLLDHLRTKFFLSVKNENQFERYVNYYRWIDKAIGAFLNNMIPAGMSSNTGIENVVESHTLERNKIHHKLANLERKDLQLDANALGVLMQEYSWSEGSRASDADANSYFAARFDGDELGPREAIFMAKYNISQAGAQSGRSGFNAHAENALTTVYSAAASQDLVIDMGPNKQSAHAGDHYRALHDGHTITIQAGSFESANNYDPALSSERSKRWEYSVQTSDNEEYTDGNGNLLSPITLYNNPLGTDFSDTKPGIVAGTETKQPVALQGPWVSTFVGGMPHSRVRYGVIDEDRAEAYDIHNDTTSITFQQPAVGLKPISQYSKGPSYNYNVQNIKTFNPIGNYDFDYQIVLVSGRASNNSLLTRSGSAAIDQVYKKSDSIPQLIDFAAPVRGKREHIIATRFSAVGSPHERAPYGRDRSSDEFSPYSGVNNRNYIVRESLNNFSQEHSAKAGLRPMADPLGVFYGSWHKTHRNPKRIYNSPKEDPVYDNLFVQSHIPQNDFGYRWIIESAQDDVYSFLKKNANMGHQHNFEMSGDLKSSETITFVQESSVQSELDFVGLNIYNAKSVDDFYTSVSNSSTSLNTILLNNNGPYGWPSWKQSRVSQNILARAQRRNNIISSVFVGNSPGNPKRTSLIFDYKDSIEDTRIKTLDRTTRHYKEVMVTKRFQPICYSVQTINENDLISNITIQDPTITSQELYSLLWDIDWATPRNSNIDIGETKTTVRATIQNNITSYANEQFVDETGFKEQPLTSNSSLKNLNVFIKNTLKMNEVVDVATQLSYIEKIYPKEENTFTKKARIRENFSFFGWSSLRNDRKLNMKGNVQYGDYLFNGVKLAPKMTVQSQEEDFKKVYYNRYNVVDLPGFTGSIDPLASTHITHSTWVLDSREDFSMPPVDIVKSYYNNPTTFMSLRNQATRGEGILQNDYSLHPLGINALHGAPPIAPVYNRRVIQNHQTCSYLSGESKWEATSGQTLGPFYDKYEEYSEKLKLMGKEYSLVPDFRISRYVENILKTSDKQLLTNEMTDFLQVTGTVNNTSSADLQIGSEFFKTYSNSDFLKYFLEIQKNNEANKFSLKPDSLTLKCKAVKKFLPYRGFYPAERIVQLSEIFDKNYLPQSSYEFSLITSSELANAGNAGDLIKNRVQNSKSQVLRPIMGPGVLLNSIKSGIAVDYPIFSSSIASSLNAIYNNTKSSETSMMNNFALLPTGNQLPFTGSVINSSTDSGISRLSGSVSRRITFEDVLYPARLYGEHIHDNEPHSSGTLLYGSKYHLGLIEQPTTFGSLDPEQTKLYTAIDVKMSEDQFTENFVPFKSAVHNFTAETVNFFLEDGKLTTLLSDPVVPELTKNKQYKMFVYLENTGISMYDRHSAFGPPVDEGTIQNINYVVSSSTTPAAAASGSVQLANSYSSPASIDDVSFTLKSANSVERTYQFRAGSSDPSSGTVVGDNYIIKINGMDITSVLNEVKSVVESIHSGAISVDTSVSNKIATFTQTTAGTDGNHTISKGGTAQSNINILGFAGGSSAVTTTGSFLARTTTTQEASHGYLPYVPPFLDPNTSPYAEITFTPPETDTYTIPQIIQGSVITYYNMSAPSGSATNINYNNAMNIAASLDLSKYILLRSDNSSYTKNPDGSIREVRSAAANKYRWVIQSKWETPVLDFRQSSVSALNLNNNSVSSVQNSPWKTRYQDSYYNKQEHATVPYLTASTGMWHQYGNILSHSVGKGYSLGVAGPYVQNENSQIQSLATVLGFAPEESKLSKQAQQVRYKKKKIGRIAKNKQVCESVVAIPYYINNTNEIELFSVNADIHSRAKDFNSEGMNHYRAQYTTSENREKVLEEYEDWNDDTGRTSVSNHAYQLRMMDKYVLPPQFDFLRNPKVEPHVQYIFQFKINFDEKDLAGLWQNLYPEQSTSGGKARKSSISKQVKTSETQERESLDTEYVVSSLSVKESGASIGTYKEPNIFNNEKVRWLVFKCKYRAISNYSKLIRSSFSPFEEDLIYISDQSHTREDFFFDNYGYNWPYDYFSIVELAEVCAKVDFRTPTLEAPEAGYDPGSVSTIVNVEAEIPSTEASTSVINVDTPSATAANVVNRNFITVTGSSGGSTIEQESFTQTLKSPGAAVPSPANQLSLVLPIGYSIKPGSQTIYLNGVAQVAGSGYDYTLSGNTITFASNLTTADGVTIEYSMANSG